MKNPWPPAALPVVTDEFCSKNTRSAFAKMGCGCEIFIEPCGIGVR